MPEAALPPVSREVFRLAWPVVLSESLHTLFHVADLMWVGRLGAAATAAISSSIFTLWVVQSLAHLVAVGVTAQVARAVGAGDRPRAARAASQSWILAVSIGSSIAVAGIFLSAPLFRLLATTEDVAQAGSAYLLISALGAPLLFLEVASSACLRAAGDTRTPMWITASALIANVLLAPFLIYGWAGLPPLGVPGAAIATLICHVGAAAAFVRLAFMGHPSFPFDRASLGRPDRPVLLEQIRIGVPMSIVGILFSVNYMIFARLAAPFGAAAIAVIGIGNRIESVTYLGADGFGVAAATLVGQNLGAGLPKRAARCARLAAACMATGGAVVMLAMLTIPAMLITVFSSDAGVLAAGVPYMRILGLCQIATGIEGVLSLAFAGAGDTLPPMTIHLVFGALRPVLAAALAGPLGFGLNGIAITIAVSCILRAIILSALFVTGRWARARVGVPIHQPDEDRSAPSRARS